MTDCEGEDSSIAEVSNLVDDTVLTNKNQSEDRKRSKLGVEQIRAIRGL